jgi:hypothetical protein
MLWYTPNTLVLDGLSVAMPLGALYNNVYFQYGKVADADASIGFYSPVWQLGDDRLALHTPFTVVIPVGDDANLTDRMLLARVAEDGRMSGAGGKVIDGFLTASVRSGRYCVTRDTVAPVLRPVLQKDGRVSGNTFRITATDNLAGITHYDVRIDGEWTLASFKNSSITVYLSEDRLRRGRHDVKVSVTDAVGNSSEVDFTIVW